MDRVRGMYRCRFNGFSNRDVEILPSVMVMVRSMKLTLSLGALSSQHTFTTTIVKHHKDDDK